MRVPQSPHTLRKFVSTSSSSDSETETNSDSEKMKLPPKQPFNKNGSNKKELRHEKPVTNNKLTSFSSHRSRERTRISAVQRLVERKMAQKEKDREKESKDREAFRTLVESLLSTNDHLHFTNFLEIG